MQPSYPNGETRSRSHSRSLLQPLAAQLNGSPNRSTTVHTSWSYTPPRGSPLSRFHIDRQATRPPLIGDVRDRLRHLDFSPFDSGRRRSVDSPNGRYSRPALITPPDSGRRLDSRTELPYHHGPSESHDFGSLSPIRLPHSRPLPIAVPPNPAMPRYAWPSPTSSDNEVEQSPLILEEACASPKHRHQHHPSGDLRTPLPLTASNLRMSESFHAMCLDKYLAKQPVGSIDNALDIHASRDVLEGGESLQNTFRHIRGFLYRFSHISISLRAEPDSPDPTGEFLVLDDDDAVPQINPMREFVDLEDAVNLKSFTWRGGFIFLTTVVVGLPKNDLTALCITDCEISPKDAVLTVRSFPNLKRLELDRIDDRAENVLCATPFLYPTSSAPSQIERLKITSSIPLQGFLKSIRFMDSNTRLKSVHFIPHGKNRNIVPDLAHLEQRFLNPTRR